MQLWSQQILQHFALSVANLPSPQLNPTSQRTYPGNLIYLVSFFFFFFLNLFFLFFLILFLNFTILYLFCQISKWICHRYTCVPHPEPSSLLPPHTIPLGHPSAPAPSIQYHALNLDWRLVSYMILYMFQCHSPKSSHPLLLPQSPLLDISYKWNKTKCSLWWLASFT